MTQQIPSTIDWSFVSALFSVVVSLVALTISGISLWASHLSPFTLEITHNDPTFSLYKISYSKKQTWWIPSFDVSLSFYNKGQRIGRVMGVRIMANTKLARNSLSDSFIAKWVVNYASYSRHQNKRGKWAALAVEHDWYPLILPSRKTISAHIILEMPFIRWDNKREGIMEYTLEVLASNSAKWKQYARYRLHIDTEMFESQDTHSSSPIWCL